MKAYKFFTALIVLCFLSLNMMQFTGCSTGGSLLMQSAYKGDIESLQQSLDDGEDINQRDARGYTPLMTATYYNFYSIADYLLKNGADIDAQGKDGRTALILATCNKNIRIIKLLMKYNPNVDVVDHSGRSAKDHAANLNLKVISKILDRDMDMGTPSI